MGEFVIYSVKVSLCLVMFYVFYKLLLSRTTLHTFNRFVILCLVAVSLCLPFVHITVEKPVIESGVTIDQFLMMATVVEDGAPEHHLSAVSVVVLIYIIGVLGFFIRMILSYVGIVKIMKRAVQTVDDDGMRIFVVDDDIAPFSWFRNIVISAADYRDHSNAIITHEKAHAVRGHSADILLCNILTVVQWFNPAAWLLKAELQDVHEYEADEAVLQSGIDATGYQLLLVRKAVGDKMFAIANNLNKVSLKKRIAMMKTKKTNRWASMKALVVLPLAAVAVVAFATPEMTEVENTVKAETEQLSEVVKENVAAASPQPVAPVEAVQKDKKGKKVYDVVEQMPEFPGGMPEMFVFLSKNIKYPKEAMEKNQHGRVIVKFVVSSDGSLRDVAIVRSISPSLDAEALRVVKMMPKWNPGKVKGKAVDVKYVIPISFSLNKVEKEDGADVQTSTDDIAVVGYNPSSEPKKQIDLRGGFVPNKALVLVDGKKVTEDELNKLDLQKIESITSLNSEDGRKQYGEEGKDGVMLIKMRK